MTDTNNQLCTTFALAHEAGACSSSYRKMAKAVSGISKYGEDTPLPLSEVLTVCGLSDTLWCFRCVLSGQEEERDRVLYSFLADVLEHIRDKLYDDRSKAVIPMLRRRASRTTSAAEIEKVRIDAIAATYAYGGIHVLTFAGYAAAHAAWDAHHAALAAVTSAAFADAAEREWQEKCLRQYLTVH